jgi:hypothetical protein
MKKKTIILFVFIIVTLFSCEKGRDEGTEIVINEIMPRNKTTVADQDGEFDDWIELYNYSPATINLSGYYLSDSKSNPRKWKFPQGTIILAKGYLIIWADKDTTQQGLHSNFGLSSLGEKVIFSKSDGSYIDKVEYPAMTLELSYSRFPNGTGSFRWQNPTFNTSNGGGK